MINTIYTAGEKAFLIDSLILLLSNNFSLKAVYDDKNNQLTIYDYKDNTCGVYNLSNVESSTLLALCSFLRGGY